MAIKQQNSSGTKITDSKKKIGSKQASVASKGNLYNI